MTNFIGIDKDAQSCPIYRFTTINRVLNLLDKNKNTLVSPKKWDDPFENILSRMNFKKKDGNLFKHPLRDRAYGQCWTTTKETDAAWRMYIHDGNGVRLKSTIRKLHQSLFRSQGTYASMSCYIGRVQYKSHDELSTWFSDSNWVKEHLFNVGSKGQAKSLLFKRKEFEPEQEIRLLYLDPHNMSSKNIYSYNLNVSDVIEQITFDPRMEEDLYEMLSSVFVKLGYTGTVDKSELYKIPTYDHDF